jgi:hypothetical protein
VLLHNEERIEALFFLYFLALLVQGLIERELRRAMQREGIGKLATLGVALTADGGAASPRSSSLGSPTCSASYCICSGSRFAPAGAPEEPGEICG